MRLVNCHIENFGKLSDFSADFEENLSVFRRENGWGKSTLAAFLRVMFFGFEGETKRKGIENERKRYAPWQGGVYGGQIVFETGGKRYILSRVFADKKQNDVFELRDAETNLASDDFSDNLGEEMFRMNSESFRRSVFIGQNDCVTHATDGINAKMGNLADSQNDLDCYEKASVRLADELNRLHPRRKTGEIFRKREQVTALETEVAAGGTLPEALVQCETLLAAERASLEEKRAERKTLAGLAAQVSRAQDLKAKQAMYAQLLEECGEKQKIYDLARAAFPGEVPEEENLQSCLEACDALAQARQMLATCRVDEAERQFAGEWENAHAGDLSADEAIARKMEEEQQLSVRMARRKDAGEAEHASETAEETVRSRKGSARLFSCLFGIVFLVLGAVLVFLGVGTSKLFFAVGVIFLAAGLQLLALYLVRLSADRRAKQPKQQSEHVGEGHEKTEELSELWNALRREEQQLREQSRRYQAFLEKQKKDALWRQKYELERQSLSRALDEMGILLPDALKEQQKPASSLSVETGILSGESLKKELQELWKKRILLAQAARDLEQVQTRRRAFAEQNSPGEVITGGGALPGENEDWQKEEEKLADEYPTLEALNARMAVLDPEMAEVQNHLRAYEQQFSGLQEKYDVWAETKERLETARARLSDLKREYRFKQKAQQYLTQAKETLTARYMEPLMKSFSHYYQLILKQDAGRYHLDANANLTAEEQGMQRETIYLSTGYQDLLGLCMRLAFVEAMYQEEQPFLILDDPFVNFDDEKLAGARSLLEDAATRYQVVYFTCSNMRTTEKI